MVLLCKLCSYPFEACLNSETRPCHTLICTGKGVESECGEISGKFILDFAGNSFSGNIPHPTLITLSCIKGGGGGGGGGGGVNIQRNRGEVPKILSSHFHWGPQDSSTR